MTLLRPPSIDEMLFPGGSGHIVYCSHACHCSCHTSRAVHIIACCSVCPVCHGYVTFVEAHLKECHPNVDAGGL